MGDMRSARRALNSAAMALAPLILIAGSFAESSTSSTLPSPPTSAPVVFEFEINRTSEPLSLFNVLPPPLPLNEVLRQTGGQTTSGATVAIQKTSAGTVGPLPTSGSVQRTPASKKTFLPKNTRASTATLPPAPIPFATMTTSPASQPPSPSFREYPDTVVLTNGSSLPCRILGEAGQALRIELSNGVIVHMPNHRIAEVNGKTLPR